jgi:hypothetical protein
MPRHVENSAHKNRTKTKNSDARLKRQWHQCTYSHAYLAVALSQYVRYEEIVAAHQPPSFSRSYSTSYRQRCIQATKTQGAPALRNTSRRLQSTIAHNTTISSTITQQTKTETASKSVAYWLLGMSGLVATMVSIGGITRLTRSGLSMTDWKLQGSLPPLNAEAWQREFDRFV